MKDPLVIVRSANERSTDHCVSLLRQLFTDENIIVLNEKPFSQAIRKSFEIGAKSAKEWMLCIDADVFVSAKGIQQLFNEAVSTNPSVFQVQGLILDKFFPIYRPAGNHLYRTRYMKKAVSCIPDEGTSLRPETDMLNAMSSKGYGWKQVSALVGLHDYEQNYRDIYRKCFLQAHKHRRFIPVVSPYWKQRSGEDKDFEVALRAVEAGAEYTGSVMVSSSFLSDQNSKALEDIGIAEKEPLTAMEDTVDHILQQYEAKLRQEFIELQNMMFPKKRWTCLYQEDQPSPWEKVKGGIRKMFP